MSSTPGRGAEQRSLLLIGYADAGAGADAGADAGASAPCALLALSFQVARGAEPQFEVPVERADGVPHAGTSEDGAIIAHIGPSSDGPAAWTTAVASRVRAEAERLTFLRRHPVHAQVVFGPNEWAAAAVASRHMAARQLQCRVDTAEGAPQGFRFHASVVPSAASIVLIAGPSANGPHDLAHPHSLHRELVGALALGERFDGKRKLRPSPSPSA